MRLRSLLFVPGDSERKFARARDCGADALILDLEDSVAPSEKANARDRVAGLIGPEPERAWTFIVRVNALDTGLTLEDLAAVVKPGLDALLIPKVDGAADLERIAHYLDALEAKAGMASGSVKLASVATETPKAMFALGSYAPAHPRLIALTWGAEDLSAALGATANKEPDGSWTFPYQLARAQCLFAASDAGVMAIDTIYADFRDSDGLEQDCRRSRRDGFVGRARDPSRPGGGDQPRLRAIRSRGRAGAQDRGRIRGQSGRRRARGRRQDGRPSASESSAKNPGVDLTASFVAQFESDRHTPRCISSLPVSKMFLLRSNVSFSNNSASGGLGSSALRPTKTQVQTYIKGDFAGPFLTGRRANVDRPQSRFRRHAMADEALFGLLRQTADPAVVEALKTSVESDQDRLLNRINPLAYASEHGLDEEATIGAFVHAARLGLFDMSWNMLCPSCGGVIETGAALKNLNQSHYYCSFCTVDCEPTLDTLVEVTFTVNPRIRRIAAHDPDFASFR